MKTSNKKVLESLSNETGRDYKYVKIIMKHYFRGLRLLIIKHFSFKDTAQAHFYSVKKRKFKRTRKYGK